MLDLSPRVDGLLDSGPAAVLADAAFGGRPGIALADLPVAADPAGTWLRAIVLGGRGWYAAARTELLRAARLTRDPALGSLVASTEASLLRQLGWHARAAIQDGRAAALVANLPVASAADPMRAAAVCDALTGLAADALGTGQPQVSARLLRRCRGELDRAPVDLRTLVRWHWVSAETALAAPGMGLVAEPASTHAEAAVAAAERMGSVRHQVKSRLLQAAAAAGDGDIDRSRAVAELVDSLCAAHGLLPLRWAAAMLRSGVCEPAEARRAAAEAGVYARVLAGRGGRLRVGPEIG
ncbi:hypothetical protein [Nocardia nova]|uniref:hypothetical protein n=1 Tax=Nocardia nova TaxID=37330 RepID=UPI000CEA316F|nr:hypothetical protein [Nocardia nova]PPJ23307.1 hypothetical protein C5E41_24875 [Nocardia nova]